MANVQLVNADIMDWAASYTGPRFHALFCDAPYELHEITDRFGSEDAAPAQYGKDGAFQRLSRGFMGKTWDGQESAFKKETWTALSQHLYPGAFLFVFAGTLNDDLISLALRQAGLRKHHKALGWLYSSGFPKATRVKGQPAFDGHRYGLQALKPALEPLLVFQKPYEGRPVENIVATGAGALNIDGARIAYQSEQDFVSAMGGDSGSAAKSEQIFNGGWLARPQSEKIDEGGRWPANFFLDEQAAERLDKQSGNRKAGGSRTGNEPSPKTLNVWGEYRNSSSFDSYDDEGGASRFFFVVEDQIDLADPVHYCPKASRAERDAGLDNFSLDAGTHRFGKYRCAKCGRLQLDYAPCTCQEPEFIREATTRNPHPTVKPISLNKHLATLLMPPAEYGPRRILIPYGGVASDVIGAMMAGWEEVVGIEQDAEYCEIGRARIAYWKNRKTTRVSGKRIAAAQSQPTLFGADHA
jgi:site-specific DNA-methyltransferase (adenine-specific)